MEHYWSSNKRNHSHEHKHNAKLRRSMIYAISSLGQASRICNDMSKSLIRWGHFPRRCYDIWIFRSSRSTNRRWPLTVTDLPPNRSRCLLLLGKRWQWSTQTRTILAEIFQRVKCILHLGIVYHHLSSALSTYRVWLRDCLRCYSSNRPLEFLLLLPLPFFFSLLFHCIRSN